MKCSICESASAQLHTEMIDGKQREVCLCHDCYQKLYSKANGTELFAQLFGGRGTPQKTRKVCPSCGLALESFQKSGLVGCAQCYTAFRNEINQSIRYCQRSNLHCGKSPLGAPEIKYDLLREQESLLSRLNIARKEGNEKLGQELSYRLENLQKLITRAEAAQQRRRTEAEHDELHPEEDE